MTDELKEKIRAGYQAALAAGLVNAAADMARRFPFVLGDN